jgi:hypothetical protein
VEVERVDRNFTRVAVVTGSGVARYLDKNVSEQIHEFIRKQLIKPSAVIQQPES